MLFNSIEYFVFLPIVYAIYALLGHRQQNRMLLLASYVFYAAWDVRFLYLITLSTAVDFYCGAMIARGEVSPAGRRRLGGWIFATAVAFVGIDWTGLTTSGLSSVHGSGAIGWAVIAASIVLYAGIEWSHHYAQGISEARRRHVFVTISVVANLGILGVLKYFDFFVASAEDLAHGLGFDHAGMRLDLILPVGISFYTFQTMSYTLDIYRRQVQPVDEFLDFALFVGFFPQLVAGPIERASGLIPKLIQPRRLRFEQICRGLFLILLGLVKKVAIADGVAGSVDSIFQRAGPVSWLDVVLATILFAVQIYGDFSGYSDIARGTSKLFGIDLMLNFRLPYFSANPQEFWNRWHISLSTWLRDYLYIPLGGNRGGKGKTYRNLLVTMLLGGLWHGAAWNYILWGGYHGALLAVHRATFGRADKQGRHDPLAHRPGMNNFLSRLWRGAIFFPLVCYGWLLFRANSFAQIREYSALLVRDFGNLNLHLAKPTLAGFAGIAFLIAFELRILHNDDPRFYLRLPTFVRGAFYAAMVFIVLMGTSNAPVQFIYFQF
jgi:alginate O-acetyltransferase complex protein AlgI